MNTPTSDQLHRLASVKLLSFAALLPLFLLIAKPACFAQDQTVNGNLSVSGNVQVGWTNITYAPVKLTILGNPGLDSTVTINGSTFLSAHTEPNNRVTMLGTNLYWNGSYYVEAVSSEPGLALEVHQGANALVLTRMAANATGPVDVIQARIGANGTNTYFNTQGGNVGIGIDSPNQKLSVHGNMAVDGAVLIAPQGDLPMGGFTAGPQPTL